MANLSLGLSAKFFETSLVQGSNKGVTSDALFYYLNAPNQITITTAVSITTATTAVNTYGQKGRNVIIDNGVNAINIVVDGGTDFVASYVKHGTGAITFIQGAGRTLVQVDGTNVLNGILGSTATISSQGTTDYLRISNA